MMLFAFASSITPGPNNLMLMTSGVNFGFVRTLPHLLGVGFGFTLMVTLIGLGLAEVFTHVPIMLVVLKGLGAAYLVYLAVKIARSGPVRGGATHARPMTFVQAVIFQWVNPKAWIMAVTACATYAMPDTFAAGTLIIALVFGVVNLPCIAAWAGFGAGLRRVLSDPAKVKVFNSIMAALLILSLYPLLTE